MPGLADAFRRLSAPALMLCFSIPSHLGAAEPASVPIRLILIDRHTEEQLGPLPWTRERHARLVSWLDQAGARAVAMRFYFRDGLGDAGDEELVLSCSRSGRVFVETARLDSPEGWQAPDDWIDRMSLETRGPPPEGLIDLPFLQLPFAELAGAVRGTGAVDVLVDEDRQYSAMPLLIRHRGRILPSLGLRIYIYLLGREGDPVTFLTSSERFLWFFTVVRTRALMIAGTRIALDDAGCTYVKLSLPGRTYQTFSYADVLAGLVPGKPFRGAVVIVGADRTRFALETAVGPKSGPELVADQIAALLDYSAYGLETGEPSE